MRPGDRILHKHRGHATPDERHARADGRVRLDVFSTVERNAAKVGRSSACYFTGKERCKVGGA